MAEVLDYFDRVKKIVRMSPPEGVSVFVCVLDRTGEVDPFSTVIVNASPLEVVGMASAISFAVLADINSKAKTVIDGGQEPTP